MPCFAVAIETSRRTRTCAPNAGPSRLSRSCPRPIRTCRRYVARFCGSLAPGHEPRRGADDHDPAQSDRRVARADGHPDGDGEDDKRRVYCVADDRPEPHDRQRPDQAEGSRDIVANHLRHHRDEYREQDQRDGKRRRGLARRPGALDRSRRRRRRAASRRRAGRALREARQLPAGLLPAGTQA